MVEEMTQEMLDRFLAQIEAEPLDEKAKREALSRAVVVNTVKLDDWPGGFIRFRVVDLDDLSEAHRYFKARLGAEEEE